MGERVKIEIMDTTLRDGEQTSGVSFVPHEKLMIARLLLEDLKVDRVEVASARVSDGEFEAVKMICDWAARRNLLHKVEVLGFVDGHTSVDWIQSTGCRVINLLCKGSLKHCTHQLKKTPEEHIEDIINVVHYADELDIAVNVYLEDWSNGMKDSPEFVFQLMDGLKATSKIRTSAHADAAVVPVVAMSAYAFTEDIEKSRQAGMDEYITKPINIVELCKLLNHLIALHAKGA